MCHILQTSNKHYQYQCGSQLPRGELTPIDPALCWVRTCYSGPVYGIELSTPGAATLITEPPLLSDPNHRDDHSLQRDRVVIYPHERHGDNGRCGGHKAAEEKAAPG